jgi:hypothetical protein
MRTPVRAAGGAPDPATLAVGRARRAAARPVVPGSSYPAGAFCSTCGLCDTEWVGHVGEACAFLGSGEWRERGKREGWGWVFV